MKRPAPSKKRTMHIEEADNGGFITRTGPEDYGDGPRMKNVHADSDALMKHVRATFPPAAAKKTKAAKPAAPGAKPQWAGVANQMLGKGY